MRRRIQSHENAKMYLHSLELYLTKQVSSSTTPDVLGSGTARQVHTEEAYAYEVVMHEVLKDMTRLEIESRTSWLYIPSALQLSHQILLNTTWIVLHILQYAPNNTVSTCSNPETSNLQT